MLIYSKSVNMPSPKRITKIGVSNSAILRSLLVGIPAPWGQTSGPASRMGDLLWAQTCASCNANALGHGNVSCDILCSRS